MYFFLHLLPSCFGNTDHTTLQKHQYFLVNINTFWTAKMLNSAFPFVFHWHQCSFYLFSWFLINSNAHSAYFVHFWLTLLHSDQQQCIASSSSSFRLIPMRFKQHQRLVYFLARFLVITPLVLLLVFDQQQYFFNIFVYFWSTPPHLNQQQSIQNNTNPHPIFSVRSCTILTNSE